MVDKELSPTFNTSMALTNMSRFIVFPVKPMVFGLKAYNNNYLKTAQISKFYYILGSEDEFSLYANSIYQQYYL